MGWRAQWQGCCPKGGGGAGGPSSARLLHSRRHGSAQAQEEVPRPLRPGPPRGGRPPRRSPPPGGRGAAPGAGGGRAPPEDHARRPAAWLSPSWPAWEWWWRPSSSSARRRRSPGWSRWIPAPSWPASATCCPPTSTRDLDALPAPACGVVDDLTAEQLLRDLRNGAVVLFHQPDDAETAAALAAVASDFESHVVVAPNDRLSPGGRWPSPGGIAGPTTRGPTPRSPNSPTCTAAAAGPTPTALSPPAERRARTPQSSSD